MAKKDYYSILGVSRKASVGVIRFAFRRLAKEYHPDRVGAKGTSHFQEITEAYSVLSDPEARKSYDDDLRIEKEKGARDFRREYRERTSQPVREPLFQHLRRRRASLREDLFHDLFGLGTSEYEERDSVDLEVILAPEEASQGGVLRIPLVLPCPVCAGTGHSGLFTCLRCLGRGRLETGEVVPVTLPAALEDGTILELRTQYVSLRMVIRVTHGA